MQTILQVALVSGEGIGQRISSGLQQAYSISTFVCGSKVVLIIDLALVIRTHKNTHTHTHE